MTGVYDDYAAFVERVSDEVAEYAIVGSPSDIAVVYDLLERLPACYLMPGTATPAESGNRQLLRMEDQQWRIVVVAKNIPGDTGEPETTLGRLVLATIDALHQYQSPSLDGWLEYERRSGIEYDQGYAYVELQFNRRRLIQRT